MSDSFDPYYKWLSIPPAEQPANHYRLLGVPLLVDDPEVIEMAADRQMMAVRTFQNGPYAAWSQHILNEITQAKLILLNPEHKAAYDALLRQQFAPQRPAAAPIPQAQSQPADVAYQQPSVSLDTVHTGAPSTTQRRRGRKRSGPPVALLLISLSALAVIAITVVKLSQDAQPPTTRVSVQPNEQTRRTGSSSTSSRSNRKTRTSNSRTSQSGSQNGTTDEILDDILSRKDLELEPPVEPPTLLPQKRPLDLLKLIDPEQNSMQGKWRIDRGQLISEGKILDRIQIPYEPPEDYDLLLDVTHESGPSKALIVGLVGAGRPFHLVLNEMGSGIGHLDGKEFGQNESTHRGRVFVTGTQSSVVCKIRRNGLSVSIDDQPIIDWKGDFERTAPSKVWTVRNPRALWIGANAVYRISKIEIKPYGESPGTGSDPGTPDRPSLPGEVAKKLPIPSADDRREALSLIKDLHKDQYSDAKQPKKKFALAKKFYDMGRNSLDDPIGRYVLLHEAARLAAEVGDSKAAIEAISELNATFEIDDIDMRLQVLAEASKRILPVKVSQEAVRQATRAVDDAVAQDRFDEAIKLGQVAITTARKSKDVALTKRMADRVEQLKQMRGTYQGAQAAMEVLASDPNDAAANLALGRYLCFVKQDWTHGLPRIAQGDNAELKTLAENDLANPTDPKDQAALGDQWWEQATSEKESARSDFKSRAKYWYQSAMPGLSALSRLRIEKRLRDDAKK